MEELLQLDGSNEEYQELAKSLAEVIELTEDLLREASQPSAAAPSQPGASETTPCAATHSQRFDRRFNAARCMTGSTAAVTRIGAYCRPQRSSSPAG